jgi:hypothetical protein
VRVVTSSDATSQRDELRAQRRKVDFDTYDITVDELVRRVASGRIEVAPAYQRQFRWDAKRQSRLIESVLLGIPVPPLFLATNVAEGSSTSWEVVDGLQRLLSLVHFLGGVDARLRVGLPPYGLKITGLELLKTFDGFSASDLPADVVSGLLDRPMKAIVLNDKSDLQVRFDLFERLNTGGVRLTDQEIREAVFQGEFVDLLGELAHYPAFRRVVLLPSAREKDGTPEDYALRLFAFSDNYRNFEHSVHDFLLDYCAEAAKTPDVERRRSEFMRTFDFLEQCFPEGIRRHNQRITPVNLFEAIAVGALLALRTDSPPTGPGSQDVAWVRSDELRRLTTGATNDRKRVRGRIEYCRDRFLRHS